jgi:hypothetical protein
VSTRRLPPGDNPFRPLRCRDVTLLALAAITGVITLFTAWLAGAL